MSDIIDVLKDDHAVVAEILTELKSKPSTEKVTELSEELNAHADAEETAVYSRLFSSLLSEAASDGSLTLNHAVSEHQTIREALGRLQAVSVEAAEFKQRLTALREAVEHHVDEEENIIFPAFRKKVRPDILIALVDEFDEAKGHFFEVTEAISPKSADSTQFVSGEGADKSGEYLT